MARLIMFETVSLDGYFTDAHGDMSWAHAALPDPEWNEFVSSNASGGGILLFGRVTYEMMAGFWPTPMAAEQMPIVARRMNEGPKVVASRTIGTLSWANSRLINGDLVTEIQRMKEAPGPGIAILGSGSIVTQLAAANLIDEYQIVVAPVVLGAGRTLFEGLSGLRRLKRTRTREFANGNVVSWYEPTR